MKENKQINKKTQQTLLCAYRVNLYLCDICSRYVCVQALAGDEFSVYGLQNEMFEWSYQLMQTLRKRERIVQEAVNIMWKDQ